MLVGSVAKRSHSVFSMTRTLCVTQDGSWATLFAVTMVVNASSFAGSG